MRSLVLYILLTIAVPCSVFASDDAGTGSPFTMGAGARELSLSGASLTNPDLSTAAYWNPAVLAHAERWSVGGFHSRLYDSDVAYQYLGIAVPTMDFGGFGLGIFRLGIDDIERRNESNLLLPDQVEDDRLAFFLAYGREISGYDIGISASIEHHSIDSYSSTSSPGINISIGRSFRLGSEFIPEAAFVIGGRNLLKPGVKLVEETYKYPNSFEAGASVRLVPFQNWNQSLTLMAALEKTEDIDPRTSVGLEYNLESLLKLRGSVSDGNLSFGGGIGYRSMQIDYAFVERDLDDLHMFSISTSFGMPISKKRKLREQKREKAFNELMHNSLMSRNREMVSDLLARGQDELSTGNLVQADALFDRALFICRSGDLDSSEVKSLSEDTKSRLVEMNEREEFAKLLDSAEAKLEQSDYLAAEYFANQALEILPTSVKAQEIIDEAGTQLEISQTSHELIERRVIAVDSLLNYGRLEEALSVAQSLEAYSDTKPTVRLILRKAEFEFWRAEASTEFNDGNLTKCLNAVDSALARFPDHPWCLNMREQASAMRTSLTRPAAVEPEQVVKPLSEELAKEVAERYEEGRSLFEKGSLDEAVQRWERVEMLSPGYMSVRDYLIKAYKFIGVELYGRNDLKKAVDIWKKAAELDPSNTEIAGYIKRTETEISRLNELSYEY